MIETDPFNYYCVDCKQRQTTHASLSYGIFICDLCAAKHQTELGPEVSCVIPLFTVPWDDYMIKFMNQGGNRTFHNFIVPYQI